MFLLKLVSPLHALAEDGVNHLALAAVGLPLHVLAEVGFPLHALAEYGVNHLALAAVGLPLNVLPTVGQVLGEHAAHAGHDRT